MNAARSAALGLLLSVPLASAGCSESVRTARHDDLVKRKLGGVDGQVAGAEPDATEIAIEVRTDADVRPISPLIYGTHGAPEVNKNRQTVLRAGGNRYTAYNWENNASNAGQDYQFQNDGMLSESNAPAKPLLELLEQARSNKASVVVTVPIGDYVAADKNGGGDVRNSGATYLTTRFKRNEPDKDTPLSAAPDPSDGFVYQDEFVRFIKRRAKRTPVLFALGNEPELWSTVHAEVQPRPITYAELWDRNLRYAQAVKRVWPEAEVLGLACNGWSGFVDLQDIPDARGRDLIEWYLQQAKAAAGGGSRLIDYLDLHWYPATQAGGTPVTLTATAPAVAAARVQAPRSLWDPTYEEKSWVREKVGGPIELLHRLAKKIGVHYPGTKLSFSEWNYGAGHHISGAIATADVLGIFGREGVALATLVPLSSNETFNYAALRAYRNYDGKGGAFGDLSVRAASSDVASVTAYASLKSGPSDQVVVIAINKTTLPKAVSLHVGHPATLATARIFELSGTAAELVPKPDQASLGSNTWQLTLPAYSVSVIVPHKG